MFSKSIIQLLKILLFVTIISYAIDKLVFLAMNIISDKVYTGQSVGKLNHFIQLKDSCDLLILGNSRANHHFDIDLISDNGFNFGVNGTGIAHTSTILNTIDKLKKQFVIIHIDIEKFFDKTYNGNDISGLKIKYNRIDEITKALDKSNSISPIHKFYKSINYNGKTIGIIKNYLKPNYNYLDYNGYDPLFIPENQKSIREQILDGIKTTDCSDKVALNNSIALNYLKQIKDYIKSSEKQIIFITSPIYYDYCKKDNLLFASKMRELELEYYDFSDLFSNIKDKSLWKDRTHLSSSGAQKFTTYILNELKLMNRIKY